MNRTAIGQEALAPRAVAPLSPVARPVSLSSPACQAFQSQALPRKGPGATGPATEQLVVIRDGQTLFDWSDGVVKPETPRGTWSVAKTVTATLIGTAVQDGKIKLDDPVAKYLPEIFNDKSVDQKRFQKIKIRDLLAMTSGFEWTENTTAPVKEQSDLDLLYSRGFSDMVKYIRRLPFSSEPGTKWNYSSVNAILAMAVLRKAYGSESNDMPWNKLFNPLGMKNVRFEKDRSGTYVGGAYIHMSARDLAKLGQLYANDGVWNGKRLLPENWVNSVAKSPVPLSAKNAVSLNKEYAGSGAYSQGSFWLNKGVNGGPKPFPHLPDSMMYTSGLFGQTLVVLPEQNMIISRTGHDKPGEDLPIDAIVANAMKCFASNVPGTPKGPPVAVRPAEFKVPSLKDAFETLEGFSHVQSNGSLTAMLAKELCSCRFISGLDVNECLSRGPIPPAMAHFLVDIRTDVPSRSISVYPRFGVVPGQAQLNMRSPREGCGLTYGLPDHLKK